MLIISNTFIATVVIGFLSLVMLLGLVIIIYSAWGMFQTFIRKQAPFVPIPHQIITDIIDTLELKNNDVLYDLGCGDGRVLKEALKSNLHIKAVGIEYAFWPSLLARWRLRKEIKAGRARIVRADMFKQSFKEATVIYTYLFPEYMTKLQPKLETELPKGTRHISCDFTYTNKEPLEVIDLDRPKNKLGRFLYIYKF